MVSYTMQREDGKPMEQNDPPFCRLYFNGKEVLGGLSGSTKYLDEEHLVVGCDMTYDLNGIDVSGENDYELIFSQVGYDNPVRGKWRFRFRADATALLADTVRTPLNTVFTLPNGETVTFTEFTSNELEQRINFRTSGSAMEYDLKLTAKDQDGNKAEYYVSRFTGEEECKGYMLNAEIFEDGRIHTAGPVEITLYAVKLPEGDGKIGDDYEQIGEAVIWNLS